MNTSYRDCKFFDDVNGHKELDWSSVVEAWKLEMAFCNKMEVIRKSAAPKTRPKEGELYPLAGWIRIKAMIRAQTTVSR